MVRWPYLRAFSLGLLSTAAIMIVGTGAARGDSLVVPHEGISPLAITIDGDDIVYVVDLFSGLTHKYDLDLNHLGTMPSPGGTETMSGITWNPITNRLYWMRAPGW